MFAAVPAELRQLPHWLLWRKVWLPDKQKFTKQPLSPHSGQLASVTNLADLGTFDRCAELLQQHAAPGVLDGIGFAFGFGNGVVGTDLDRVFDDKGRVLDQRAHAIADALGSYTELSPSGTGLHVLALGNLEGGRRRENIEVYGAGRFFTVTGVPYGMPRPLADRSAEIAQLVSEIDEARAAKSAGPLDWSVPAKYSHEQLWNMARNAANGTKFYELWYGQWQQHYGSQSEADFALIDMLAFYSDSPTQVRDMFMLSALGQRDKATTRHGYVVGMVQRSFDRKVPLVAVPDLPQPLATVAQAIAAEAPAQLDDFTHDAQDIEEQQAAASNPYVCPHGLVGELAAWFYRQSLYPIEELAITAALGVVAGIVGRQFQLNGSGLNLYVMLLASTGAGKEVLSAGTSRLFHTIASPPNIIPAPGQPAPVGFEAARDFQGPQALSGKGLLRFFDTNNSLSCVSVVPEFSQTMSRMADPRADTGIKEFQQVLLDFYTKSSMGSMYAGSMNADKTKDVKALNSPAFTLVCEGTPERFWRAMTDQMVTDGLMSRFLVIEREGYSEVEQPDFYLHQAVPDDLKARVASLCELTLSLRHHGDQRIHVAMTPEAAAYSEQLRKFYRARGTKEGSAEVYRVMWLRAHQNLTRIAALLAIGVNQHQPTIMPEHLEWADRIVARQVTLIIGKFRRGEIGQQDDSERQQHEAIRQFMDKWVNADVKRMATSGHAKSWSDARQAGLIPLSYFHVMASKRACFRSTKFGATDALKRAVSHCERIGWLSRRQLDGHSGEYYAITG